MNGMRSRAAWRTSMAVLAGLLLTAGASPGRSENESAFTYQGELQDDGQPANGSYDLEFGLWDAASGGTPIGVPQVLNNTPVTDGLFTVQIDFGADAFDNSDRWLEITVNGIALVPRQPITRAPYSIQTRGIFVDDAGNVGIRTGSPIFPLEVHNNGVTGQLLRLVSDRTYGYVQFVENSTPRAYLGYGDDGDLLVNALPDSFAIDGASTALHFAVDSDATRGITIDTDGNVGIGTTMPLSRLTVGGNGLSTYAIWGEAYEDDGVGVGGYSGAVNGIGVYGWALETGVAGQCLYSDGVGVSGKAGGNGGHGVEGYGGDWDFYAANAGSGNYGAASSIRWKENIIEIDEPLEKAAALRGVYFDWDAEHGGHHDLGMIAEEVGAVLPEIVSYETNGIDANAMDYSKLTPLLVEAVNALRAEKDAEIAELEQQIRDLRRQVEQLATEVKEERQ